MKKLAILILAVLFIIPSFPQNKTEESGGKFSGYMFGDYYYFIDNHNNDLKDEHGFWFRRIYFTYDYKINSSFSTRLRLEMADKFNFENAQTIVPFIKDAWLKYKFSKQAVIIGISPTPTWDRIEHIWGYRSVEKTPLDLQKMGSSRDFGVSLKGQLDKKGMFKYQVMVGNSSGNKQEIDKGKSAMLSLAVYPTKNFVVEAYGDVANKNAKNWETFQGFAAYVTKKFRAGVQYAYQSREINSNSDQLLRLASFFVVGALSDQFSLLGRVDRNFDANPKGEGISYIPFAQVKNTFFVGGLDWHPVKGVSFIPNIEYIAYDDVNGETPTNDVIARITFYWKFK